MITSIRSDYTHKVQPYEHQQREWDRSRDMKYYALWWEPGTCKSKTIIDTFTWLYLQGQIDGVLIISDKGCYENWATEIPKQMMEGVNYKAMTYSSSMRKIDEERLQEIMIAKDDRLDILLMNVEAFSGDRGLHIAAQFCRSHYTMAAVDESTSIKNPRAVRTKNLIKLASICDYRRVLTGTPITQCPLDLYSQCEFLHPGVLGHRSFTGFKSEYAVTKRIVLGGGRSFEQIIGYRNLDKLTAQLYTFSSRILKSECLDLPDKIYETINVEHTPEQKMWYQKIKQEAMVMHDMGMLTITSALTQINKLHQINCGHVKLDDGTVVEIPSNRVKQLVETLENIGQKAVVWCAFQKDVEMIIRELESLDGEFYPTHYYGLTSTDDRAQALSDFKNDPKCRWFVGTASTGGKGIDGLQNVCSYQIYFSNADNLEDRIQSEDRLHRNGQKSAVTIFDMVTTKTVDVKILERYKQKQDLSYEVLDKFKELLS